MNRPTQGENGFMEPGYEAGVVPLVDSNNGISTELLIAKLALVQ